MLYEMRTYTVKVGNMPEVLRLYTEEGYPALEKGGQSGPLGGYMVSDTGTLHQLVHIWKHADDTARREHWKRVYANKEFMAFAVKLRPLLDAQEVRLLVDAPFGPKL